MTRKLLGKHPNVYTFTKGLAEHLAMKTANDLPFAIVRPSIGEIKYILLSLQV